MLVYNRFGSFNPFGMIFALSRDLVSLSDPDDTAQNGDSSDSVTADRCDRDLGTSLTEPEDPKDPGDGVLTAGDVRLRDCERPRPLVLRANAGDLLKVRVRNLLRPEQPGLSETFCRNGGSPKQDLRTQIREAVSEGDESLVRHGEVLCKTGGSDDTPSEQTNLGWPRTRTLTFGIQGMVARSGSMFKGSLEHGEAIDVCRGLRAIPTDAIVDCTFEIDREGTYFLASNAAPAGGEGNGGSITHGLFGAVVVEQRHTRWYRSQVSKAAFDKAWPSASSGIRHARSNEIDYEATEDGLPLLNLARPADGRDQQDFGRAKTVEIVHGDLNAIIFRPAGGYPRNGFAAGAEEPYLTPLGEKAEAVCRAHKVPDNGDDGDGRDDYCEVNFREFSVFFHDELKTFYTRNFEELGQFGQLAGVRDGFAINYGSSGMGAMVLANRKNIGPAADCVECLYEEFFLTSWANGDPALLEQFSDDPSNVHHSYLNDAVTFRNFHAGPKETHVFHLHAHQWFAGNDSGRGSYLDSQTVAPQQGFTYDIYHGGLRSYRDDEEGRGKGWFETLGSGNRNRTIGDSIFHCHLYPHFAQGMWELWRVHDVLEDGTRKLPDGQEEPGLSLTERTFFDEKGNPALKRRPGSVHPWTGQYVEPEDNKGANTVGTPIPAVVPLPNQPLPLLPTYAGGESTVSEVQEFVAPAKPSTEAVAAMPGYPFTIAGRPGHRPPQPPMDIARKRNSTSDLVSDEYLDAGLPRHVVRDGGERTFGVDLPDQLKTPLQDGKKPAPGPDRERVWSQAVAKMLALGDMTAHLDQATLELLPYDGTPLERAAMGFHADGTAWGTGAGLNLKRVDGGASAQDGDGEYATLVSPSLGSSVKAVDYFSVNGAPPKPGAPFADPCGNGQGRAMADPFLAPAPIGSDPVAGTAFTHDPGLIGFRRYEVSAVQVDLVTNRAGWHDPQARINVLTEDSARFKDGSAKGFPDAPISPLVSAREEPFFFRALSGECIEFRHTNELPKELELDDFQVKTPTDTIGQHIHLVKFDVTSSDGSGNGFNYEDGTFAPDEVAARICAAKTAREAGEPLAADMAMGPTREAGALAILEDDLCKETTSGTKTLHVPENKNWWRHELAPNRGRFQTTVQRWFADPIRSWDGTYADDGTPNLVDRTMRTVFTHDHFGPSSIQQHGFYAALVIEPQGSVWSTPDHKISSTDRVEGDTSLINGSARDIGTRKVVTDADDLEIHPDYREFAIAIADFALLYDPRDRKSKAEITGAEASVKGMAMLHCELVEHSDPEGLDDICGSAMKQDSAGWWFADGNVPPAWHAAGRPGDNHGVRPPGDPTREPLYAELDLESEDLRKHLLEYRRWAAQGTSEKGPADRPFASPVAPPERPESISVDHHDPYLVNYRGEPIPLRVGTRGVEKRDPSTGEPIVDPATGNPVMVASKDSEDCRLKPLLQPWRLRKANGELEVATQNGEKLAVEKLDAFDECSVEWQRTDEQGDMAAVFSSLKHFDPATPIIESYSGERNIIRLIQGAQEVQHTFTMEGIVWHRNIDQRFPSGARLWDSIWRGNWPFGVKEQATMHQACQEFGAAREGRPREYVQWERKGWQSFPDNSPQQDFWRRFTARIADCDNLEGVVNAQEIGISEHFEFGGSLRAGVGGAIVPQFEMEPAGGGAAQGSSAPGDYLYHFGSQDALWNGAWGLVRIHDADGPDITKCLLEMDLERGSLEIPLPWNTRFRTPQTMAAIQDRGNNIECENLIQTALGPPLDLELPEDVQTAALRDPPDEVERIECPADARHVYAMAVASKAPPLAYGSNLTDPDALHLALADPRKVFPDITDFIVLFGDGSAGTGGAQEVALAGAELDSSFDRNAPGGPFVLRLRAGDCVHLALVNGLEKEQTSPNERPVLSDALGDARMPPIVPLNVDPAWRSHPVGKCVEDEPPASCFNRPWRFQADLSAKEIDDGKHLVAPSARVAFELPVLSLTARSRRAAPFGVNRVAPLAPLREEPTVWLDAVTFYAGRGALPELAPEEIEETVDRFLADALEVPFFESEISGSEIGIQMNMRMLQEQQNAFYLMPERLAQQTIAPPNIDQIHDLEPRAGSYARLLYNAYKKGCFTVGGKDGTDPIPNCVPYAYGALAIKSLGDVIGHGSHGLLGALVVEPANWHPISGGPELIPLTPDELTKVYASDAVQPNYAFVVTGGPPAWGASSQEGASFSTIFEGGTHRVREHVVFYRDGMNLWDAQSKDEWVDSNGVELPSRESRNKPLEGSPVANCHVCDDSYDFGEQGVDYQSAPFNVRLRSEGQEMNGALESHYDLNAFEFDPAFFLSKGTNEEGVDGRPAMPILRAEAGEEVVIRVLHPSGRARQRAFVTVALDYDDLFPGFGFPHSALVAPGKGVTASIARPIREGCYLWHDGPTHLRTGGTWGLLDVVPRGMIGDAAKTSCSRRTK